MTKIFAHIVSNYISNQDGATAVEYGLIGAFIAVAVAAIAFVIGDEILATFDFILGELQG